MPRQRPEVLREFRAALGRQAFDAGSFANGFANALLDVAAEYEVSLREAADEAEVGRLALRQEWREVLVLLRGGPRLPSDLAEALHKDRPTVTRILKKLRAAGLVQSYALEEDGRTRPHRLTAYGRRVLDGLDVEMPSDVERGIRLAVALFQEMFEHGSRSRADLDALARDVLGDPSVAAAAVSAWGSNVREAGLVGKFDGEYHLTPQHAVPLSARHEILWSHGASLLAQINAHRRADVPVFVRTTNEAWGAWAYALQDDSTGLSRTIVNGDILSRTIEPPARYDLLYDDPAVIGADRQIPTMQSMMDHADAKFVIASGEDRVPEGFVQLDLQPKKD
ncbi:MarR family winged helix-turn-helix transcriptional regulator [Haliangium ochraceum]|nr:MarR family winged helix-turn-helix transcriptional regulator [Haliangium ochraceum]